MAIVELRISDFALEAASITLVFSGVVYNASFGTIDAICQRISSMSFNYTQQ